MTKTVLLAIIALGTIASLALWILKRWFGKPEEISKFEEEVDELTEQMEKILHNKPVDWELYNKLNSRVWKLNRKIRRLFRNKTSNNS